MPARVPRDVSEGEPLPDEPLETSGTPETPEADALEQHEPAPVERDVTDVADANDADVVEQRMPVSDFDEEGDEGRD